MERDPRGREGSYGQRPLARAAVPQHQQPGPFTSSAAAACAPPARASRFRGRMRRAGRCASTGVSPKSVSVKREKELKTLGTVDPDLFSSSWALLGKDSDLRVVGA